MTTTIQFMTSVNEAFKRVYGLRYSEMLSIAPSIDYSNHKLSLAHDQGVAPEYFATLMGKNAGLAQIPENSSSSKTIAIADFNSASLALIEAARDESTDLVLSNSYPIRALCERDGHVFSIKPNVSPKGFSEFSVEICTDKNLNIRTMDFDVDGMLPSLDKSMFLPVKNTSDIRYAFNVIHDYAQTLQQTNDFGHEFDSVQM